MDIGFRVMDFMCEKVIAYGKTQIVTRAVDKTSYRLSRKTILHYTQGKRVNKSPCAVLPSAFSNNQTKAQQSNSICKLHILLRSMQGIVA